MVTRNGDARHKPASFLEDVVTIENDQRRDRSDGIPGMPPNLGKYPVRHIGTFQGYVSTVSSIYRDFDEAMVHSLDSARFMRNDCGIMESIEARQRATALLNWHLEPEDDQSQEQRDLVDAMTVILSRIRRFTEYRFNLMHAIWYGRYGIQHRYGWQNVRGHRRLLPTPNRDNQGWLPVSGDKLVFRFESDRTREGQFPHQVGVRVGPGRKVDDVLHGRWRVEATDRGLAFFLTDPERKLLAIHKHSIEDGEFESPHSGGRVHGVGIRSRIYWDWVQKQESLGFLIEFLERSAGGIELWKYPLGNDQAKQEAETAAKERIGGGRNMVMVPVPTGEEGFQYGVEVIEPGMAGVESLERILNNYFGHRIKRYILGQVLSSEAEAAGLGSGLAELHYNTFLQIIHYDSANLEETITNELLRNLQLWNFPNSAGIHLQFKIETEKADQQERLKALHDAWEMGARINESDVLEIVGTSVPGEDDKALVNPLIAQAESMQAMQQGGGMGGGPPEPQPNGRSQVTVPATIGDRQQMMQATDYAVAGQASKYAAAWDESKHPRDDDGTFGSSGGTSSSGKSESSPREINVEQFLASSDTDDPGAEHGGLSPSGSESKRARSSRLKRRDADFGKFAERQREFQELVNRGDVVDPTGRFTVMPVTDKTQAEVDRLLRVAKELRDFADRGMRPRAHRKEADRLEAKANALLGIEDREHYAADADGRWVTIGAQHQSGGGGDKGGAKVFIKDGKITKGPKGLTGKTLRGLSRQSVSSKRNQAIREAAKLHEVDQRELSEMVDAVWPEMRELAQEREDFKRLARQRSGMTEADAARIENGYRDYSSVPGFDQVADELAMDYPHWFPSGDSPSEALWDLLREGKQSAPAKHDPDVINEAVERLSSPASAVGTLIDGEHVPFSRVRHDQYGAEVESGEVSEPSANDLTDSLNHEFKERGY